MRRALAFDRSKAAALFIDLQEEHRGDERYLVAGYDALLANAATLQRTARAESIPVFHAAYLLKPGAPPRPFHPMMPDGTSAFSNAGDPLSAICPEMAPVDGETVWAKSDASVFSHDGATSQLRVRRIEWLVIAGVWTEACVAATVRDAVDGGFHVLLVKAACGSGSIAMHETAIINLANRLYGGAVADTERAVAAMKGDAVPAWHVQGSVPLRFTYENAAQLYRDF